MLHLTFWRNLRHSQNGELVTCNGAAEFFAALYTRNARPDGESFDEQRKVAARATLPRLLWTPAKLDGNSRVGPSPGYEMSALVLNYNDGSVTPEQAIRAFSGYTALWQASLRHSELSPRFHLVVPLSEAVPGGLWPNVFENAIRQAVPGFDPELPTGKTTYFAHWRGAPRAVQYGELFPPDATAPEPASLPPARATPVPAPRQSATPPPAPARGTATPAMRRRSATPAPPSGRERDAEPAPIPLSSRNPLGVVFAPDTTIVAMGREMGFTVDGSMLGPCPDCGAEHRSEDERPKVLALTAAGDAWHCKACKAGGRALDLIALVMHGKRADALVELEKEEVRQWLAGRSLIEGVTPRGEQGPSAGVSSLPAEEEQEEEQDGNTAHPPVPIEVPARASYAVDWVGERLRSARDHGFSEEPPQPEYFLNRNESGIMQRGVVGLVASDGGLGKCYSLLDLALLSASRSSEPWLGAYDLGQPGPALVVMGEDSAASLHRRLDKLTTNRNIDPRWQDDLDVLVGAGRSLSLVTTTGERTPLFYDLIRALKRRSHWGVIILEPLIRFASGDLLNDQQQGAALMNAIQDLAEAAPGSPPVIVGCHSAMCGSLAGGRGRTTTAIATAARWVALMREDVTRVHARFGRPVMWEVVKASEDRKGDWMLLLRRGERGGLLTEARVADLDEM